MSDPNPNPSQHRAAGLAALAIGLSYLVITGVYVAGGALPDGVGGWLDHMAGHQAQWWTILGLSVATDVLFLPLLWSLYLVLYQAPRGLVAAGTGLVGLFAVLDLAVTWPNYAVLISLSSAYGAADDAGRAALVAAATYPYEVLSSTLFGVYAVLVPAVGILVLSVAMLRAAFGRVTAGLGLATGVLGTIAVAGGAFRAELGWVAVPTSVLTTAWIILAGRRLLRVA